MNAREWKPGDVAAVTNEHGVENVAICQVAPNGNLWQYGVAYTSDRVDLERPARRLVVIDPDDTDEVKRLMKLIAAATPKIAVGLDPSDSTALDALYVLATTAALREFANPTPPRIEEPAVWGVVEASCEHTVERLKWMRHEDGLWWPFVKYNDGDERRPLPDDWESLVEPTLVREGASNG